MQTCSLTNTWLSGVLLFWSRTCWSLARSRYALWRDPGKRPSAAVRPPSGSTATGSHIILFSFNLTLTAGREICSSLEEQKRLWAMSPIQRLGCFIVIHRCLIREHLLVSAYSYLLVTLARGGSKSNISSIANFQSACIHRISKT